jgi:histidine ammonia-lyase
LLAAAQGVDFHAPLRTSSALDAVHSKVRAMSPHLASDRYWADEMAALQRAVLEGAFGPGDWL